MHRLGLLLTFVSLAPFRLFAQADVTLLQVAKTISYEQTSPDAAGASSLKPYHFYLGLQGTGLDSYPRTSGVPAITLQGGLYSGGTLTTYSIATPDHSANQPVLLAREWDFALSSGLNTTYASDYWAVTFHGGYWDSANFYTRYVVGDIIGDLYPNTPFFTGLSAGNFSAANTTSTRHRASRSPPTPSPPTSPPAPRASPSTSRTSRATRSPPPPRPRPTSFRSTSRQASSCRAPNIS